MILNKNVDSLVKSLISCLVVIPAKAGIQLIQIVLDTGVRRYDGCGTFYEFINIKFNHELCRYLAEDLRDQVLAGDGIGGSINISPNKNCLLP